LAEPLLNSSGEIEIRGSYAFTSPLRTFAAKAIMSSQVAKLFHFNWPLSMKPKHFEFTANLINELRKEYLQRIPNGKFYVLIFPLAHHLSVGIIPYLEKSEIPYFDYSGFKVGEATSLPTMIDYDSHPTPETYRIVGEQLARDIHSSLNSLSEKN
jgi:hypothetical protein